MSLELSDLDARLSIGGQGAFRVRRRGIGLEQTREDEGGGRNAMRSGNPTAAGSQKQEHGKDGQPQPFPIYSH